MPWMAQLVTGHCALNAHQFRFGFRADSICDCGATEETIEHFLFCCPLYDRTDLVACSLAAVNCWPPTLASIPQSHKLWQELSKFVNRTRRLRPVRLSSTRVRWLVALLSLSGCKFLSTFTSSSTFLLLFLSWRSPIFDSLCVPNIFYPPCTATTNRNLGISAACGLRAVLGSYTGGQHCACSWRSNQAGQVPNGEVEPQATLTEPGPPVGPVSPLALS